MPSSSQGILRAGAGDWSSQGPGDASRYPRQPLCPRLVTNDPLCVSGQSLPSPSLIYTGLKKIVQGQFRLLWGLKRSYRELKGSEGFRG